MNTSRLLALLLIVSAFGARAATVPASRPAQTSASAAGGSFAPQFSAGGQHLVFISHANNLVTNDDLAPWLDVFVRALAASNTVLASVNSSGIGGGNADAHSPSISSNGQLVAFVSRASNLVSGDTNNAEDVFARDVVSGTTRLVSVDVNGSSPMDPNFALNIPLSGNPLVSEDGRWVVFESRATNLTATAAPFGSVNIYARDLWSNVTVLVSADTNGLPLADKASLQSVSADGRFVSFISSNLAIFPGVTNVGGDAYVRDLQTGATIWASTNVSAAMSGGYACRSAMFSADARLLVLDALASGSVSNFTVIRQSRENLGTWSAVATNATASPSEISADGRRVLFQSAGLWVYDDVTQSSQRVSWDVEDFCGVLTNGAAAYGTLSRDGQFVAMQITARVGPFCFPETSVHYLYRRSIETGESNALLVATNGVPAAFTEPVVPVLSPDGLRATVSTLTSTLVERDYNNANDIFLRDVNAGATELISAAHASRPSAVGASFATLTPQSLSSNGQFIVFSRLDEAASPRDTNGWADVFLSDTLSGNTFALSVNTNDSATNGFPFVSPVISANGRSVAMVRRRSSSILGFPTDLRVARANSNGVFATTVEDPAPFYNGTGQSFVTNRNASFSADGELMAFDSTASQLTEEYDYNNAPDVFVRHFTRTNPYPYFNGPTNFLISKSGNYAGEGPSMSPTIHPAARWLIFLSKASNLSQTYPGSPYDFFQCIAADLGTDRGGTNFLVNAPMRLVSYSFALAPYVWTDAADTNVQHTNINAILKPLSNDVVQCVFSANATHVVFGLANRTVYRHDLLANHTNIVFTGYTNGSGMNVRTQIVAGAPNLLVCTNCTNATVSADGEVITYERLRAGTSNVFDIYARDLRDGGETLVSGNLSGGVANGSSSSPLISGDGRFVVFQSKASDLVVNDTNGFADIFVRDRLLGVTMLVSANAQGRGGNGPSSAPVLAPDGRTVAFQSFASDLVPGDYNDKRDIFVLKLGSADSDGDGLDDDWELAYFETLARDGSGDADNDGINDRAEFLAGTDPTKGGSIFRVLTVSAAGSTTRHVIWTGNPARNYRVEFKDDVTAPGWTTLNASPSWNGSTATATDNAATNAMRFYRVVRLP